MTFDLGLHCFIYCSAAEVWGLSAMTVDLSESPAFGKRLTLVTLEGCVCSSSFIYGGKGCGNFIMDIVHCRLLWPLRHIAIISCTIIVNLTLQMSKRWCAVASAIDMTSILVSTTLTSSGLSPM